MPDYTSSGVKFIGDSTPAADGFYFPAEWEEHERTIMVLPPPQNWKGYGIPLDEVRDQWADVANKLVEFSVTDGHIDGIAAFASPGVVLLHTTSDRSDPNFKICQDAKSRLRNSTDAKGRAIEVIEVPLDGDVSYLNFYIANECVLVPITGQSEQDDRPMGILREVFDDDDIVGIDSNILGEGGGGIHCITQQVPKAMTSKRKPSS